MKFPTAKDEQVILHVNFSYSALPPAPKGFDFDAMRRDANESWKRVLDGFDVKGGTAAERRIFATAIYHSMIDPRRIDSYPMGNGYTLERTVFSGWDVFRSEMPLLCLIAPETVAETVDSMMKVMEAGRRDTLPVWDLFGCKSSCMLGNPLIPVMLSALDAGINIDLGRALPLVEKTMKLRGNGNRGYCENDISKTLEYCYDYWCAARLAERAGNKELMARMDEHSRDYTNIWDETVGWMHGRGRDREGEKTWSDWKGLTVHGQGCVESNPYQQGWFVPHDVPGLIGLMGGEEKFIENLVPFFEKAPKDFLWGDYYNHPNEPSHHIAFLFAAANRPWPTQKWTRAILANAYQDNVRGLCGNDDVGQMSAWYVLAAIGINPMCPGSGRWVVSTPLFERVSLPVKDATSGKIRPFTVIAKGAGDPKNIYITSAKLNGRPLERAWLYTKEIMSGSTLELQLGPEPNEKLFTEKW